MRSSRLADLLVEECRLSRDAAKKRISRVGSPIQRLPISLLPKREAFVYHERDHESTRLRVILSRDLKETNSIYGLALYGLEARGGVAQVPSFDVISGAPEVQAKQIPLSAVLSRLINTGIVERAVIGEQGNCVRFRRDCGFVLSNSRFRAQTIAERILLDGLHEWARNMGLASYDAVQIRSSQNAPKFGPFHWDVCGPSYVVPLVAREPKPGFFVADVFYGRTINEKHIKYLTRKVDLLKTLPNMPSFLPIVVAERYSRLALRAIRSAGIVTATIDSLFGEGVSRALKSLVGTLAQAAEVIKQDPERIGVLLNGLKAIEGRSRNLRGALFNLIVGFLVLTVEGGHVDIGTAVQDPETGGGAEIDVRRIKERQECWFYECKARRPDGRMEAEEVKTWLNRVGRIYRYHRSQERFQRCSFGFELWTTGGFDESALELLRHEKQKRKKMTIEWRDGVQVRAYATKANYKAMADILKEHYFKI